MPCQEQADVTCRALSGTLLTDAIRRSSFLSSVETEGVGFGGSFHIPLIVRDNGDRDVNPKSIQLATGRTEQEFNQRKNRKDAYWQDRYHATAVETGRHLVQCLLSIDIDMVLAGVVKHSSVWPFGGYIEFQKPMERYALVDYAALKDPFDSKEMDEFSASYRDWIEESLKKLDHGRDGKWTESIAMGSESFVTETRELLGFNGRGRGG